MGNMGALRHGGTLGGKKTPTYSSWASMMARCRNPHCPKYEYYGGRGIKVCRRWDRFENFLADVGERPASGLSLDRFPNPDGDYKPGNVRWATRAEQLLNRRCTLLVTFRGKRMRVIDACGEAGLSYGCVRKRLKRGWSPSEALSLAAVRIRKQYRPEARP